MAIIKANNQTLSGITSLPTGLGGKILQIVQGNSSTQFLQSSPVTDTVYFPSTNKLSASITPSSTSSKILVEFIATLYCGDSDNDGGVAFGLKESISGGSTTTIVPGNSYASGLYFSSNVASNFRVRLSDNIYRTPSTTSQITYEVGVMAYASSVEIRLMDTNSRGEIILTEIAG